MTKKKKTSGRSFGKMNGNREILLRQALPSDSCSYAMSQAIFRIVNTNEKGGMDSC